MLTLNNLINFIEPKQIEYENINNSKETIDIDTYKIIVNKKENIEKLNRNLSFIFDSKIENYYTLKNNFKSFRLPFLNFLDCILIVIDNSFYINKLSERQNKLIFIIKQLIIDIDEKNYYHKFYYNKNRKIKKNVLQDYLYKVLNFSKKLDNFFDIHLDQYIVDYFGINVFIFDTESDNIKDNSFYSITNRFNNKFNKFVPTILLLKKDNKYFPILNIDDNSIIKFSKSNEIINRITKYFKLNEEYKLLESLNLKELRQKAIEMGIDIKKISEKTKKKVFKKKNELLNEINIL